MNNIKEKLEEITELIICLSPLQKDIYCNVVCGRKGALPNKHVQHREITKVISTCNTFQSPEVICQSVCFFPLLIKCRSDCNNYTHLILEGKPRKKKPSILGLFLKAVLIIYPKDLNAIQKTVNSSEERMTNKITHKSAY